MIINKIQNCDIIKQQMQSKLQCSFHSSNQPISKSQLQARQQSILNQYEKIMANSETPQYSQETLPYCELPKFINQEIKNSFSQCIFLDRFTFYEMFTMLISQYLFKAPDELKLKKINHFKSLVYSPDFLEGSLFTKGLIIKGLKQLEDLSKQKQFMYPLGQCLLNCDSICAFTECWKQLAAKICEQNNMPIMKQSEIDSSIFELFASYFHVKFQIYWKQKGNRLWKEHFTFKGANENSDKLVIIVNPDNQISVSQRSIKMSESRASGNSSSNKSAGSWNYLILTNPISKNFHKKVYQEEAGNSSKNSKVSNKPELSNGEQISRISERDYSCGQTEQIKILLDQKISQSQTAKKLSKMRKDQNEVEDALPKILNTMEKANLLIEQMRKYSEYLETLEVPQFDFLAEGFSTK